jgi:hypothetical protein
MISRKKMFGFSKIKYNFNDLKQLRLERSHLKGKKNRVYKGQPRLPCSYHAPTYGKRSLCSDGARALFGNVLLSFMVAFKALYNDHYNYPMCVLFFLSLTSFPKKIMQTCHNWKVSCHFILYESWSLFFWFLFVIFWIFFQFYPSTSSFI